MLIWDAGRGCKVIGIDPAAEMLVAADKLDKRAGVEVDYRLAKAEHTGLGESCFDIVAAGQCWHWFDRPIAAMEVKRILKPGGIAVIAHFDWLPLSGNVVQATEQLIEQHNPDWHMGGGAGTYPLWLTDLGEAGFNNIESFSYDTNVPYSPEDWRGRIRASAGVGGSMSSNKVQEFDEALEKLLNRNFAQATLTVPHRVFAVFAHANKNTNSL